MTKDELKNEAEEKAFNYADEQEISKSEWTDREYTYMQVVNAYEQGALDFAEPREKRIAELEATNKRISDECHKLVDSLEKTQNAYRQLTKAKEILKMIVDYYPCYNKTITEQAEQFLKDEPQDKWINPVTTTNDPFVR